MSRFFIERPIFASVIAIIITLAGLVAWKVLPIAQYPEIAPPTVTITASLPGASAETLSRTVAAPIEEQLSGVEGLLYFQSTSSSNGTLTITCTFEVGTDVNNATIQVNNRVQIALPRLPDDVKRTGVVVQKRSVDILLFVAVTSTDPRFDTLYLSNFMTLNALDVLKRIPGVADATILGARDYSMRIWLRPDKMAQLGITATDVALAIRAQSNQYAAGKIGQDPAPGDQALIYTVTAQGRLIQPEEFGNIVLRSSGPGGVLRVKDIARIELGAISYDAYTTVDGRPTIGTAVFLQSGANALNVANSVRKTMDEIAKGFPAGVSYLIPFDTTRFVQASIKEVIHTLFIAALLVLAVVFIFLQSWRATVIPFVAVPISLIGSFAGLYAFGFSINTLTLFAIVLATGIVVDDAIVVIENIERHVQEYRKDPHQAASDAMREVFSAVIATALVLIAVFVPVAFFPGTTGRLYQQFALTIAFAVAISAFNALTLTPALSALFLRHDDLGKGRFFRAIESAIRGGTNLYVRIVSRLMRLRWAMVVIFAALKPFDERQGDEHRLPAILQRLRGRLFAIQNAFIIPFAPPSIQGLGAFGGFTFEVLDQGGGVNIQNLAGATYGLVGASQKSPVVTGLFSAFTANDPQLAVDIDREKARGLGLPINEITDAVQIYLGSAYVNHFDFNNRAYRVYVQADKAFRSDPKSLGQYYARTNGGSMVPLASVVRVRETTAPQVISHFNLFRSAEINGSAAPGSSSGQAIAEMERLASTALPQGFGYAWSGISLEEIKAGRQSAAIFGIGILLVYLTLAAQYESLVLPFIVLLGIPLAVLGALSAVWMRGLQNDLYCQIGLVMLIGLAAKNAILIVKFAEQLRHKGLSVTDAAVEDARIRLRPILMTSLAFILGVMPLVFASGAGQEGRHSVGTAVARGMLFPTVLHILFLSLLYVGVQKLRGGGPTPTPVETPHNA